MTENLPPLNYADDTGAQGFSVELLRAMAAQVGIRLDLQVLPWQRAMQVAETQAHSILFSLTRLPEREAQFQWVGPIAQRRILLYRPASRTDLNLTQLADLGNARIGVVRDSAADRQLQQKVFRAQLEIAHDAGLPVLIHCRHAFADCLTIVRAVGVPHGGIMHAFSGSLEVARTCTRLGLMLGIAGPVTYRNAVRLPQIVAGLGLVQLVLETDTPDLAPEPLRGMPNTPAHLVHIARKVAELCTTTLDRVAAMTTANVRETLRLPPL